MKWNKSEQTHTDRSALNGAGRSGAERSGAGGRDKDLKEKKVFYIITCTHGAERNGEWNGMEWNGMEWNGME